MYIDGIYVSTNPGKEFGTGKPYAVGCFVLIEKHEYDRGESVVDRFATVDDAIAYCNRLIDDRREHEAFRLSRGWTDKPFDEVGARKRLRILAEPAAPAA